MPKPRSSEAKLARLKELRNNAASPDRLKELKAFLGDASNHVVAEAAEILGESGLTALNPDLVVAYERFLEEPEKTDKLCRAKIAIIEALSKLEYDDDDFYVAGMKYVQLEPGWGGANDSAVSIRVASAFGLVRLRYRGVLMLLVDMLKDKDKAARIGAVQALTATATETAAMLLRLKVHLGDEDPEVINECLVGMMELQPDHAIPFIADLLKSAGETIQEAALLALGSSRLPKALEVLKAFAERHLQEIPEVAFIAVALLRLPVANDYLLGMVAEKPAEVAKAALAALAVHRYDSQLREQAAAAVAQNGAPEVARAFAKKFAPDR